VIGHLPGQVSRSTLADAGEMRDYQIYQDFAYHLISIARKLYQNEELAIDLDYSLYAFDSTTIDLCLSLFPLGAFSQDQSRHKDAHFPLQHAANSVAYRAVPCTR
jgi:hypothetical protein